MAWVFVSLLGVAVAVDVAQRVLPGIALPRAGEPVAIPPAGATVATPEAPVSAPPPAAPLAETRLAQLRSRVASSSLRGTQPDGALALGSDGHLIRDAGLRRRFDYWLALDGEFGDEEIRSLLHADVLDAHGAAVAQEALAAFDRYLGLRAQLAATPPSGALPDRLRDLRAARRAWFGDDAEAMFGAEEAQIEYTLARQRIDDADLDDAERAAQWAALEASRPAAERATQREATSALLATEQTRQLDALGADAATRRAERSELWGADAAARLAALDAQRADWDRRVAAYRRERDTLAGPDAANAAAGLRARLFTPEERARIEALEAIGQLAPGG